jgi:hypothetical protein
MGLLDDLKAGSAEAESSTTDYAPSWRWEEPGDGVEGIVITVNSRVHDNHPEGYPIVTLRQPNGEDIAVHCMATVLKNEVNERKPRAGDEMAFVFDGKKSSSSGRFYNAFRVAHRPGSGQVPAAAPRAPEPQGAGAKGVWGSDEDVPF